MRSNTCKATKNLNKRHLVLYLNLGSALIIKEPPVQPWDRVETVLTPAVAAETGRDAGAPPRSHR